MKTILLLFSLSLSLFAQNIRDWHTISSMNDINDMTYSEGLLVCATNGGVFKYDIDNGIIEKITNIEGLSSLSINKLTSDNHGNRILGSSKGILDIYNSNTLSFMYLYELQNKKINGMIYQSDTLWVTADKGIGLFVYIDGEYRFVDYYVNFPIMPTRLSAIQLFNNKIWVSTDKGLLFASSDASNITLNDPANWSVYTTDSGLSNNRILGLSVINNELWIGSESGLSVINSTMNIRIEENWGRQVTDAANIIAYSSNEEYFITAKNTLYKYNPQQGKTVVKQFSSEVTALAPDNQGEIWVGLINEGYYYTTWEEPKRTDGLKSNASRYIIKDSKDRIWSSSGKYKLTPSRGFSVYENELWKSFDFSGSNWNRLGKSDVVFEDREGNIYICTWGGGIIILPEGENDFVYLHNYENSGNMYIINVDTTIVVPIPANGEEYRGFFDGANGYPDAEVIGAINEDANGNIWFSNFDAISSKYLAVTPHDESGMISLDKEKWQYFGNNDLLSGITNGTINSIEFDDLNRVWLGTGVDGVYVLDYNNTLYDKSDDIKYHLGINENLFSVDILSLDYDKNGIMWIGTQGGLNSIDIYSVSNQSQILAYKHIGDEAGENGPLGNWINQIKVDAFNNKWIATSKGLSILPDNKSPWEQNAWIGYTTRNSGLVDNDVQSIFIDNKAGETVIGTENGISIYSGAYSELKDSYSETIGGPNPYHLNRGKKYIIKNLMNNSIVRLYSINGKLVKALTVENSGINGGRAEWDGYDNFNHLVSSGIYYYLAYTNEGNSVTGKIAVLRD